MTDPHWANVVLRMDFDQAVPFTDYSNSAHVFTDSGGGITQETTTKKFGTSSLKMASSTANVNCPNSSDFKFGTGDFTIEFWLWYNDSGIDQAMSFGDSYASDGWHIRIANGNVRFYIANGGGQFQLIAANTVNSTFTHIAIERYGSTCYMYIDGVLTSSAGVASDIASTTTSVFRLGGGPADAAGANIIIDDLRITKGIARYQGVGFTPPASAYEITNSTNVSGDIGTITLSPPEGFTPSPPVEVGGDIGTITLSPPEGTTSTTFEYVTQFGLMSLSSIEVDERVTLMGFHALTSITTLPRITTMGLLVLAATAPIPKVPNPLNIADRGRDSILHTRVVNMMAEPTEQGPSGWALLGRPGLKLLAQRGSGPIRACFKWLGFQVVVSGKNVWMDGDNIGEISATGYVYWAISSEQCVLVANKRAYLVTTDDVTLIEDPNFRNVGGVVFLAGRFVYFDDDLSGIYRWSEINDATTSAGLGFASAESDPDAIYAMAVINSQIMFLGEKTTEFHTPTNDPAAPYQRSNGRAYDRGSRSPRSVVQTDSSIYFLGNDKIPYLAGSVPIAISDFHVAKRLTRLDLDELPMVEAFEALYDQHFFYVLKIPRGGTWAFDITMKKWYEWESFGSDQFRVSVSDDFIYGDALSGALFQFEGQTYTDFDQPLERVCSAWLPMQAGYVKQYNLILMCQKAVGTISGQGLSPVVEMRFSDDLGKSFSTWSEADLAPMGETGKEWTAEWTGLGAVSAPGRLFEFRCTDPVLFTVYQVKYNEVQGR